jgi:hypothetical protein
MVTNLIIFVIKLGYVTNKILEALEKQLNEIWCFLMI